MNKYTALEKQAIARQHLLPRQIKEHGLEDDDLIISEEALLGVIERYTREAGVRQLEREIGTLCRKSAVSKVKKNNKLEVNDSDLTDLLYERSSFQRSAVKTACPESLSA